MKKQWLVLVVAVFLGCATAERRQATVPVPQPVPVTQVETGWRALATPAMLRLYDEFGAPAQGGVLEEKTAHWTRYRFPDGRLRTIKDSNGDGHPEAVSDLLPDQALVIAVADSRTGRLVSLSQSDGGSRHFEDTDRDGVFDSLRTEFEEGDMIRVRELKDKDEDGHFVETATWLQPKVLI